MNNIQKVYLLESARWQKLLGVVVMISSILIALLGIFFFVIGFVDGEDFMESEVLGKITGALLGIMYILFAVLYYFFAVYLLRSAKALKAWKTSDSDADLTEGLKNTRSFFRLSGILTIISLCIFALALIGVVITLVVTLV